MSRQNLALDCLAVRTGHSADTTRLAASSTAARRRCRRLDIRIGVVLVLFVVWRQATATASEPGPDGTVTKGTSYTLTAWTGHEDVPLGDVFAIAEDRDGYPGWAQAVGWSGFDGAVFTRQATGAPARATEGPVSALLGARDGSLWVGRGGSGGVVRIRKGEMTQFGSSAGDLPTSVSALLEDRAGTVWAGGRGGIAVFRHDRWERVESTPGLGDATVYSIYEDRDGRLWLGTLPGCLCHRRSWIRTAGCRGDVRAGLRTRPPRHDVDYRHQGDDKAARHRQRADARVALVPEGGWRMASDHDGNLWVAALGGGLLRLVDNASGAPALERFPYEHKISGSRGRFLPTATGTCGWGCGQVVFCASPRTRSATSFRSKDGRMMASAPCAPRRTVRSGSRQDTASTGSSARVRRCHRCRKRAPSRWMRRVSCGSLRCTDSDASRTVDSLASVSRRTSGGRRS